MCRVLKENERATNKVSRCSLNEILLLYQKEKNEIKKRENPRFPKMTASRRICVSYTFFFFISKNIYIMYEITGEGEKKIWESKKDHPFHRVRSFHWVGPVQGGCGGWFFLIFPLRNDESSRYADLKLLAFSLILFYKLWSCFFLFLLFFFLSYILFYWKMAMAVKCFCHPGAHTH